MACCSRTVIGDITVKWKLSPGYQSDRGVIAMANVMEKIIDTVSGKTDEGEKEKEQMRECECTTEGLKLNNEMRKIWDDHVFWTREVMLTAALNAEDSPLVGTAVNRLMQNQEQLGDMIAPYYGRQAGDEFTRLLKEHIQYAVELVLASKAGDKVRAQGASDLWYQNATQIARFLSQANDRYWPYDAILKMMNEHLRLTTSEAADMLGQNYVKSVQDFHEVREEVIMMADAVTDGIMMQFPDRFSGRGPGQMGREGEGGYGQGEQYREQGQYPGGQEGYEQGRQTPGQGHEQQPGGPYGKGGGYGGKPER